MVFLPNIISWLLQPWLRKADQGRDTTRQWFPCEGISALSSRSAKSGLTKGGWLLICDGESLTRDQSSGLAQYPTTKRGARIDVIPDPSSTNDEWHSAIRASRAVWFVRDSPHVPDLPIERWFKRIAADEDWFMRESPPALPLRASVDPSQFSEPNQRTTFIPDAILGETAIDNDAQAAWLAFRTISTDASSQIALLFCSLLLCWAIPVLFRSSTGAAIWILGKDDGPLPNFTAASRDVLAIAHGAWSSFLKFYVDSHFDCRRRSDSCVIQTVANVR